MPEHDELAHPATSVGRGASAPAGHRTGADQRPSDPFVPLRDPDRPSDPRGAGRSAMTMAPFGHLVIGPTTDSRRVALWSARRLPFEPRGDQLTMREELRASLRRLAAADGEVLHAVYGSTIDGFVDVENVLLYNVGAAALARAARNGLRCERSRIVPPMPGSKAAAAHHHEYGLRAPDAGFDHWQRGVTRAHWHRAPVPPLRADTKPSAIWAAVKAAGVQVDSETVSGPFGLSVVIQHPPNARPRPVDVVKPVFDGVIAAFHRHVGPPEALALAATRIALQLGLPAATVKGWLAASDASLLGDRAVVRPYRDGVQWNPADERCLAADLLVEPASTEWAISGEIFSIDAVTRIGDE